jgi:hypothetical protein
MKIPWDKISALRQRTSSMIPLCREFAPVKKAEEFSRIFSFKKQLPILTRSSIEGALTLLQLALP